MTRRETAIQNACNVLFALCDYDKDVAIKAVKNHLRYEDGNNYRIEVSTISFVTEEDETSIMQHLDGESIRARTENEAGQVFATYLKDRFQGFMCVIKTPTDNKKLWEFRVPRDTLQDTSMLGDKCKVTACVNLLG